MTHQSSTALALSGRNRLGFHRQRVNCKFCRKCFHCIIPDSKVHGANTGPTWVLSAPVGSHVGSMNLAIRDMTMYNPVLPTRSICIIGSITWEIQYRQAWTVCIYLDKETIYIWHSPKVILSLVEIFPVRPWSSSHYKVIPWFPCTILYKLIVISDTIRLHRAREWLDSLDVIWGYNATIK